MSDSARQLLAAYPSLASVPAQRLVDRVAHLPLIRVESGTRLFAEGAPCAGFPFVLDGQVRIARGSESGRELELYRVGRGDICVVSAGCVFGNKPMSAQGHATSATRLVLVDRATMLEWTDARPFREFVFGLMAERLATLALLVESVAFQRLDRRLARRLLAAEQPLRTTHQRLADELGTAREIVSRLLGRFEEQGMLRLGRERIELVDPDALRRVADDV